MPTERFHRLPAEKVEIIRSAAVKEFSRKIPEEASINKIIQDADISRGSFYTYFENKYDLLRWLIEDRVKAHYSFYVDDLRENGGEIWLTFSKILDYTVRHINDGGFLGIIEKMMDSSTSMALFKEGIDENCEMARSRKQSYLELLYSIMDHEKYPMDIVEFGDVMDLHVIVLMTALKQILHDKEPVEEAKNFYSRRMKILEYGAGRQKMEQKE